MLFGSPCVANLSTARQTKSQIRIQRQNLLSFSAIKQSNPGRKRDASKGNPRQVLLGTDKPKFPVRFQAMGEGFRVLSEKIRRSTEAGLLKKLAVLID